MSDVIKATSKLISAHDANLRWQQSLQLYSTFAEIWIQNPQLAKQAGRRVQELVMPLVDVQRLHLNDLK
jgi:hypothetical protein